MPASANSQTRECRNCAKSFRYTRYDHYFCSGRCVAAYYRAHSNPEDIHEDLPRTKPHVCETCGTPFAVNDYAERGGQRVPKFCSSKCRQKAYRDRNGVSENRDYRQQTAAPPPPHQEQRRRQTAPPPPRHNMPRNWDNALRILGLNNPFTKDELRTAYREKMKQHHPDVNKSPDATRIAQDINWAFNYLRRS